MNFLEQSLNLLVFVILPHFGFHDLESPHVAVHEMPRIGFAPVRMRVKADGALIFMIEEQFRGKKSFLQIIAAEAQVLIEAQRFLAVEVNIQELAGVDGLSEFMIGIQAGHLDVGGFRIDAAHVGMIERSDERQDAAHGWQV